jgi:GT2 family glycosyltransferase
LTEGDPVPATPADGSAVIVVVNWNGREFLAACLDAALTQRYDAPFTVVVVDNGSTDDSVALVRERFPTVRVLINDANNYSRANNRGAALVGSEFVALLNTDAEPKPSWLAELVACLRADPRCGAATALVRFPDGRINSSGIETLPGFHWRDRDFGAPADAVRASGEVEGVSGCAALWRRACWDAIGGLDEDFEMYYEDVDASLRARGRGWRLRFCADAEVAHRYNASIQLRERAEGVKPGFRLKDQLGERNRLLVLARHYRPAFISGLASSRYFLAAPDADVARAVELAVARWLDGRLGAAERGELTHLLLGCRRLILERESWARKVEVDVTKRGLEIVALLGKLDAATVNSDHRRQEGAELNRRLGEAERDKQVLAGEVQRLNQEIAMLHAGYQAQYKRVEDELAQLHVGYQREIAQRDSMIGELRAHLRAGSAVERTGG